MTIFVGSRYEYEAVDRVLDRNGDYQATVFRTPGVVLRNFDFVSHTVIEGDRLDVLAALSYGNAELWWVIVEANPEVFDFDSLVPGTVLRIPYAPSLR